MAVAARDYLPVERAVTARAAPFLNRAVLVEVLAPKLPAVLAAAMAERIPAEAVSAPAALLSSAPADRSRSSTRPFRAQSAPVAARRAGMTALQLVRESARE